MSWWSKKKERDMERCLRITFFAGADKSVLHDFFQKHAKNLRLEGVAQLIDKGQVRIMVCGEREDVDQFVDLLHKDFDKFKIENIEIEAILKNRDFRGVFRIIE